jgi:HK97 gp10 family phage protein
MEVKVVVKGLHELEERMGDLPNEVNKKVMRKALVAGGLVLEVDMKSRVKDKQESYGDDSQWQGFQSSSLPSGALRADITHSVSLNASAERGTIRIGPTKKTAYVANFLEFGHWLVMGSQKGRKASKKRIKFIPAYPFMRPAFDNKAQDAVEAFETQLRTGIEEVTRG